MDKAAEINPSLKPLATDKMAINKQTGFWIYYAYGVAAMHKSDYLKVGGFRWVQEKKRFACCLQKK